MKNKYKLLEKKLQANKGNSPEKVNILNELVWELLLIDQDRAAKLNHDALSMAEQIQYPKGIADAKRNMGITCAAKTDVEKGLKLLHEALEWYEGNHDINGKAGANTGLANMYWGLGDFQRGFDQIHTALKLYKQVDDKEGQAFAYQTLGNFYYDWKDYKQSLDCFEKSFTLFKKHDISWGEARALNGIGNVYHYMGDCQKALDYQDKSLNIHKHNENKYGESRTLNDIGLIYSSKDQYEKALVYHQKSLDIRQKLNYPQGETTCLLDIGTIYIHQKKFDLALDVIHKALALSHKIKAKVKTYHVYKALSLVYKELGQFEKALEYHEKYHALDEEVFHEDSEQKFKNIKIAFKMEASKKEAEIYRLKNVELKEKNEQLEQTIKKLNAAQAQLVQSGKMVALGSLVSGITHEINTPVGSIKSTADTIYRISGKLTQIIQKNGNETIKNNSELENLLDMLNNNAQNTINASNRITKMIASLKNFTRLDQAKFQKVDLHEGLDSTLTLLNYEMKNRIKVLKNYGDIPTIYCYPDELNQVFMNLFLNAIEAVKETGTIEITTRRNKNHIHIGVKDSGKGIPADKIQHLFEPGFTERENRVRMRTGLYTTFNIVHKHLGDIQVESTPGKGSTFNIYLPTNLDKEIAYNQNFAI